MTIYQKKPEVIYPTLALVRTNERVVDINKNHVETNKDIIETENVIWVQ